jgi:septum formation protein
MGLDFTAAPSNFEEYLDDSRAAEDIAQELALGKALEIASRFPDALVIGSDSVVTLHGRQLGKQPDAETARKLLREMSGQRIDVFCAIALVCKSTGLQKTAIGKAAIVYEKYTDEQIETFLATDEWQDKAGATAVQSESTPPVDHIQGDYDTILGISTSLLAKMLAEQGVEAAAYHPQHLHKYRQLAQ